MSLFLAKIKNSDDRDCVNYLRFEGFVCNHYFSGMHLENSCFCGFEEEFKALVYNNYDCLETILSKDDFKLLFSLNDNLKKLGCGIKYGSDKYNKGMEIMEKYQNTIEKKLLSEENKKLYEKVVTDEKTWCKDKYNLTDAEVNEIFDNYWDDMKDRSIISYVFDNFDDFVYEEKWAFGYQDTPYFNDEEFGNDLLNNGEGYLQLESGKIVSYNY